jgi:hypothetical protein
VTAHIASWHALPRTADRNLPELGARRTGRLYLDSRSRWWSVDERSCLTADGVETRCLGFESRESMRRVRRFAPGWRTLSDADLETLSWQT